MRGGEVLWEAVPEGTLGGSAHTRVDPRSQDGYPRSQDQDAEIRIERARQAAIDRMFSFSQDQDISRGPCC